MVTRYDYETIFYTLLKAADEAVAKTRKKWTPSIGKVLTKYKLIVGLFWMSSLWEEILINLSLFSITDISQYRREMDAINPFAEMAIFPFIRNVNFEFVPKSQRSKMMEIDKISSSSGNQWINFNNRNSPDVIRFQTTARSHNENVAGRNTGLERFLHSNWTNFNSFRSCSSWKWSCKRSFDESCFKW